jgi:2-iminoacetate synthase
LSFYEVYKNFKDFDFDSYFEAVTDEQVKSIIAKDKIDKFDLLALLSPAGDKYIEDMAQRAHSISLKNFGKSILIYTPMYLANYCVNKCAYCGYNVENDICRKKLSLEEVEEEAKAIYNLGFRHIIILTGESRFHSPVSYIKDCVKLLRKYFSSICIEIYPLEVEEYAELVEAGVDSLTIYQETYDEDIYDKVHLAGPKKNFKYRLDAPERACKANIYSIGLGPLYGLTDWRKEAFLGALHAEYIQKNYPGVEINFSVPRIRPHAGSFTDIHEVSDTNMVQIMLSYKLFMHRAGINITTRENAELRDNLLPLGVTKMSAGVSTEVGGHSQENRGEKQFDTSDKRSLEEIKEAIIRKGYCPVLKDWETIKL